MGSNQDWIFTLTFVRQNLTNASKQVQIVRRIKVPIIQRWCNVL